MKFLAFSQGYVFLPIHSVGGQLLPSNAMLKYDCSEWRVTFALILLIGHQDPTLLYERGKKCVRECMPNPNFTSVHCFQVSDMFHLH